MFFMCVQLVVLPLVGYAPLQEAFINIFKGGMGPGGYYLVVFFQLFMIMPVVYKAGEKRPFLTLAAAFVISYVWAVFHNYVLMPVNPYIMEGVNKLLVFRFLPYIAAGRLLFAYFGKITPRHIIFLVLAGLLLAAAGYYSTASGVYALDWIPDTLQGVSWCTGIVACVIFVFACAGDVAPAVKRVTAFLAGSTLHILLFQQTYFCCVGVGRHKAALDLAVSLAGGFIVYVLWRPAEKLCGRAFAALRARMRAAGKEKEGARV